MGAGRAVNACLPLRNVCFAKDLRYTLFANICIGNSCIRKPHDRLVISSEF